MHTVHRLGLFFGITVLGAAVCTLSACSSSFPGTSLDFLGFFANAGRVQVRNVGGTHVSESGTSITLWVRLGSAPSADVSLPVDVSDASEAVLDRSTLVFTRANWNVEQPLRVTGKDDFFSDGTQSFLVRLLPIKSGDPIFSGYDAADVELFNDDDDAPGMVVSQVTGLQTTEGGGQAFVRVHLKTAPTSPVNISVIVSSNPSEGTVSPASMNFTTTDWYIDKTITITGQDDGAGDGPMPYWILIASAISADPAYNGLRLPDLQVVNLDDEVPGIIVTPVNGLSTTESGGTAVFNVSLVTSPCCGADVQIPVYSSNPAEGVPSTSLVTLNAGTMNQNVTITGVDDLVKDGDTPYTIVLDPAVSADPVYNGINAPDVSVVNMDNERFAFVSSATFSGNMGGTSGADAKCLNDVNRPSDKGYKALLFGAGVRVACTTANCSGGPGEHLNWVLLPLTTYFRDDAVGRIMTTDANGIFVFGSLESSFGTAGDYWTSMNGDWTGNGGACGAWALTSGSTRIGSGTDITNKAISSGGGNCNQSHALLCVEQ